MDRRVSLLLEEPLTQVLLVARLGPTVIVDVEHPLLLPLYQVDFSQQLILAE